VKLEGGQHHRQRGRAGDVHPGRGRTGGRRSAGSGPRTSWTSAGEPRPR
jgi:hypothetical protein